MAVTEESSLEKGLPKEGRFIGAAFAAARPGAVRVI
jgi:hypothetical protein